MTKYIFIALFYALGLIAVPQPGYAKLTLLSDNELCSVTARAGFSHVPAGIVHDLTSEIDVDTFRKDILPAGGVNIENKENFNFLPLVSSIASGNHGVIEFDISFEKMVVDIDDISIGIGQVKGTGLSLINFEIGNLHVEMTGSMHVSVY